MNEPVQNQLANRGGSLGSQEGAPLHEQQRTYADYPTIRDKVAAGVDSGRVVILFTDVDATFVLGGGHRDDEIAEGQRAMQLLVRELNDRNTIIIPVTGSHFDSGTTTTNSILNRIESGVLPGLRASAADSSFSVDAYVTDGGAKAVSSLNGRDITYDSHYMASVRPAALDYEALLAQTKALAQVINRQPLSAHERALVDIYDAHAGAERVFLQPGTENGAHRGSNKIAFYFYASTLSERDRIEETFAEAVEGFGMKVVCCEEKDATTAARRHEVVSALADQEGFPLKYCLDIVPFDKGSAVRHFSDYVSYLIAEHAVSTGRERPLLEVWACGDSGNDFPLMSSDIVSHVVIVGGASKELIRLGEQLSERGKSVYIESDPRRLGPASIAQAVNEGQH